MSDTVLSWLLEDENPAVRYRALTEICEAGETEEAKAAYDAIWRRQEIVRLLRKQDADGLWDTKDYGVHTSLRYLTALAEYGLKRDERIDRFAEYSIAFLRGKEGAAANQDYSGCANALVLRALVMLGYHDRAEVRELIDRYAASQLYDGGFICKRLLDKRPERKSCYKAALAALLLYAECKRKDILPANANELVGYFLKRDVFYSSDRSQSFGEGRPGWRFVDNFFPVEPMRIGLPQIVAALSILGAGDEPAVREAWRLLRGKADEAGRLKLEGTLTKQPLGFGKVGAVNKWVTFYAALAEKYS